MSSAGTQKDFLEQIPRRIISWEEKEEKIILLKPKFSNPKIQSFFARLSKNPYYRIHLDQLGTAVWKRVDGKKTVRAIGQELRDEFGDSVEPVYDRLVEFIMTLRRAKFIEF